MDRAILRKQAKIKYKEMMKSTPKSRRMPFNQAFPMLKTMIENNLDSKQDLVDTPADTMSMDDADLISGMMEVAEPVEAVNEPEASVIIPEVLTMPLAGQHIEHTHHENTNPGLQNHNFEAIHHENRPFTKADFVQVREIIEAQPVYVVHPTAEELIEDQQIANWIERQLEPLPWEPLPVSDPVEITLGV